MKKFYTLSLLMVAALSFGQVTLPYYDGFNYPDAANLGEQTGWTNVNSGDAVTVATGNLSYPGLMASSGNMVTFGENGIDPQLVYTEQNSGVVYASFLMNISNVSNVTDANGGYFAGLASNTTSFASTVWVKSSGNGYVIGLNKATGTADTVYTTTEYATNTTYLIVISYDFATNTSSMWVNPSSLGGTVPTATLTAATGTNRTTLNRYFLRQDSATETPSSMNVDELRIGTTWANVTPSGPAGLKDNSISGLKMYPNPLTGNILNITSDSNADKAVTVFDVLGKQVLTAKVSNGTVNVSALTTGVYIVKITEEGKTATRKLVVR